MNAYRFRNFINKDPILDYFSVFKGFIPDNKMEGFDPSLLLENYTRKNKKILSEKIIEELGEDIIKISNECFLLRTNDLKNHFKNYTRFTGSNYCLFTIEYSSITTLKNDVVSTTHRYYNFKNWLYKKECYNYKIDYSFVLGRRYSKHKAFDFLAEMPYSFDDTLKESEKHLQEISSKKIGIDLFPNMKNTSDYPWHNAKKIVYDQIDFPVTGIVDTTFKNNNKLPLPDGRNLLFIDFEILTSVWDDFSNFPSSNTRNILFNIGCVDSKKTVSWVAKDIEKEKGTFISFVNYVKSIENPIFVHWTNIEKRIFEEKLNEYNIDCKVEWFDLHSYFLRSHVEVRDCDNLKLKNVSRVFKEDGLIKSDWSKGLIFDGVGAMTGYIKYLETKDSKILDKILEYNVVDCLVMYEIFEVLKENLISTPMVR